MAPAPPAVSLGLEPGSGPWAGILYDRWVFMTSVPPGAQPDFQLIAQAWNLIHRNYVDRSALQSSVLTHAAIQGMTDSLGDSGHTVYLNPEMRRHASAAMRSNFTGIGIEIKTQDRRAVVVATLDGSPALLAGVRAGDIILEVDGHSAAGLSLGELEDLITGPAGAPVRLGVLDPADSRRKEFNIVRASIKIPNVTWHALPGRPGGAPARRPVRRGRLP